MAKLPSVTSKLPRDLKNFLDRTREAIDRFVTREDIESGRILPQGVGINGFNFDPDTGVEVVPPVSPTGLKVEGLYRVITLTWEDAEYSGHSFTEVWGVRKSFEWAEAKKAEGAEGWSDVDVQAIKDDPDKGIEDLPDPTVEDAEKVGTTPGRMFEHPVGLEETWYYWILHVNINNVRGPINKDVGVSATSREEGFTVDPDTGEPVELPTKPKNLGAEGGKRAILVTWDEPEYSGHGYTRVFGAKQSSPDESDPTFDESKKIAISPGGSFVHDVGLEETWYYWILHVNINNRKSEVNAVAGVSATSLGDGFEIDPGTEEPVEEPPAPGSVSAAGAYRTISVIWTQADFGGYAHAQVWASKDGSIGSATMIGITSGSMFTHNVGSEETWYYWVYFVNINNVRGPISNRASATSAVDVEKILEDLTDEITEDQFYQDLNDRINLIDAPDTGLVDRVGDAEANITNISNVTQDNGNKLVEDYTSVAVTEAGNALENALANSSQVFRQPSEPSASDLKQGDLWIDTDGGDTVYQYDGSGWVKTELSTESLVDARIVENNQAQIGYCSIDPINNDTPDKCDTAGGAWIPSAPLSASVKQVSVDTAEGSLSLEQKFQAQEDSIGNLGGQYSVKIDNNGAVSGFGLAAGGDEKSRFYVNAERFAVIPEGLSIEDNYDVLPFIVDGNEVVINVARIKDGTVNEGKLGPITIGKLTDSDGNPVTTVSGRLKGEIIDAGELNVASAATFTGVVQSDNYISGTSGWKLNPSGSSEINMSVRFAGESNTFTGIVQSDDYAPEDGTGTGAGWKLDPSSGGNSQINMPLYIKEADISDGAITNAKIGDAIESDNYDYKTAGWRINKNGFAQFRDAIISGTIDITGGSVNGTDTQTLVDKADEGKSAFDRVYNDWAHHSDSTRIDGGKIFTGDAYVDTLQIKGNAVTVPLSNTRTDTITGNDSFQNIQEVNFNLDKGGEVFVFWSGNQGYGSGGAQHYVEMWVNGSKVSHNGGYEVEDYPSLIWSGFVGAGGVKVEILWKSKSKVSMAKRSLLVLTVKR